MPGASSDLAFRLGQIAVVGAGKMGEAIIAALVEGASFSPEQISAVAPREHRRARLSERYGIVTHADVEGLAALDTVILAVKPQILREVAAQLAACWAARPQRAPKRVISIAAGVPVAVLHELFFNVAVVRVMPNIALLVGAGMSAVAATPATPPDETELARDLFACMGEAVIIAEELIDGATAISGSGPAYFALLCRELARFGESAGLPAAQAQMLSVQTLFGAARYLQITEQSPDELMTAVASPGGTTQAALESFARNDFARIVCEAASAATARAKELS
ncbi:MAG: pyrroline-5-carboxylate reductase [Coriobacteriales bacterium]|jgi:pyrroline-5-carboxylate reductase|nr:pyrroline-5-carboxylate reductase [Coriobacteriales bacterium]